MKLSVITIVAALIGLSILHDAGADLNVSITSDTLDIRRYGLQWLSASVGFALLENGAVKMTDDFGKTWQSTNIEAGSGVTQIVTQGASNGTTAVFLGIAGKTYVTRDAGKTITVDTNFPNSTWIEFHPYNKEWVISGTEPRPNSTRTFHGTLTFGEPTVHWSVIHNNAWEVAWCGYNSVTPKVCMVFDIEQGDRQFCVSIDFLNCAYPLQEAPTSWFFETPEFLVVASTNTFYVSMDEGDSFKKAELPGGLPVDIKSGRQFLDTRRKAVWFAEPVGAPTEWVPQNANAFISDREGFKFNLALRNVHSFGYVYDFATIYSINGTYIANEMFQYANGRYLSPENTTLSKTRITYDYGTTWTFLRAPEVDRENRTIVCGGICSLNLFGYSSLWSHNHYSQIYSKPEAVGIIVATGNVGDFLSWNEADTNTYVSHSGGRYWREVAEGSWDYSYAQASGILVLVKPGNQTKDFMWSNDDGETFHTQSFSPVDLTIYAIHNYDNTGEHFFIEAEQNGTFILITLDFTKVTERACVPSDYYLWIPENFEGDNATCLNGEIITYNRRKHNSSCYSTTDGVVASTKACQCTRQDFECDYNYFPLVNGSCFGTPAAPPQPCEHTYLVSQGYRKTADNRCVGAAPDYDYKEVPCPSPSTSTATNGITSTIATLGTTLTTGSHSVTATTGASITTGERIIDRGVSSGGAAAGIIIVAIFIGIIAFVLGVVAAFRSSRVRGVVPHEWKSGESARLL